MNPPESEETTKLTLDLWHPGCWILDVTGKVDVGILGYVTYTREDGRATTNYRIYSDEKALIDEGVELIRDHPSVFSVSEMGYGYRRRDGPTPGNATRDLLVEHDGRTQISEAFTSRGFVLAVAANAYDESERWSVLSNKNREDILIALEEIRNEEGAEITIESISPANYAKDVNSFPLDSLSHRQREIFQLARRRGYYRHPSEVTAGELAAELGISTSTFHEHLHKAEEKILDLAET